MKYILVDSKLAKTFLNVKTKDELEVYGRLLFSEKNVDEIKANYSEKMSVKYPYFFQASKTARTLFHSEARTIPAEGTMVLVLKTIITP